MDSRRSRPHRFADKCSFTEVMLFVTAGLVLCTGMFLLSVTMWSFIRKMFVYTHFMEIKVDTTFFTILAGLICFPTVVLTLLLKSHKLNYMLALLGLQVIAAALLFTGYFIGMVYKLDFSNKTVHLGPTVPRDALNNTLYNLIASYEASPENHTAIERIQTKFSCCGIESKDDFTHVPDSCCFKSHCKSFGVFPKGCLRSIQEDVAWHKHITSSVTQIFILMYFFNTAMVSTVFISDHYKWRSIQNTQLKQTR